MRTRILRAGSFVKGCNIKRIQTYFALLSSLLALMATSIVIFICELVYQLPWVAFLFIVPVTVLTFVLSLVIGYFLAEPLRLLLKKISAYRHGVKVSFEPDGRLYEADKISDALASLCKKIDSQHADLVRENKRQNDFVSDVAHELRTPLTAIRGNAEMLQDEELPRNLQMKFAGVIVSESERLTRLVNDLLNIQRIENNDTPIGDLSRVNLRTVAQSVIDVLHPILVERGANVEIVGEAPDVLGNFDRLKEAFTNLIENSSRFINPGGHITVKLYGLTDNAVIEIQDDGVGFGDIDPSLLFGRFYRADTSRARNTGGTGLGLAIVKSIITSHDGTIEAVNRPEGGANFIIAIPSI